MAKALRYKPTDMELQAIRALALSGSILVQCTDNIQARYQQNRLITMFRKADCGDMVVVAQRAMLVYAWMKSKFNYSILNSLITSSITPENTFKRDPSRVIRNHGADSESIMHIFTPLQKAKVHMSTLQKQVRELARVQLESGSIDQETFDKLMKQHGMEG